LTFTCSAPQASATTSALANSNANISQNQSGNLGPPTPQLQLTLSPSLVRREATTQVNWSATNVQSCKVSAPNGDTWSGLQSIIGGETSSSIKSATTYTLTCLDLQGATETKTATVRILPGFQEL
jgi:hypothetical protein